MCINFIRKVERKSVTIVFLAMLCLCPLFAAESVNITVHRGGHQTFKGLGSGRQTWTNPASHGVPDSVEEAMAKLVWSDCNFKMCQIWNMYNSPWGATRYYDRYHDYYDLVKKLQPDIFLFYSVYFVSDFDSSKFQWYVDWHVEVLKELKETHGMTFDAMNTYCEPNNVAVKDYQIAGLIKMLRQALDSNGLKKMGISGPGNSGVSNNNWDKLVDAVLADSAALDAIDAIGWHSYNMCSTKDWRDKVEPYTRPPFNKDIWVTEAGFVLGGDEGEDGPLYATNTLARILNDINLGLVNYWCWFQDYGTFDINPGQSAQRLIEIEQETHNLRIYLKYYFMKQFSQTIEPNAIVRFCTTDLPAWEYMHIWLGNQPPVNAVAAVNADGKWGIGILNATGTDSIMWKTTTTARYQDSVGYTVSILVEELEDVDTLDFTLCRSNVVRQFHEESVTMQNGRITISVAPQELVTLKAKTPTPTPNTFINISTPESGESHLKVRNSVSLSRSFLLDFVDLSRRGNSGNPIRCTVYDMHGSMVRVLAPSKIITGNISFEWNGENAQGHKATSGVYLARVTVGRKNYDSQFVLR